MNIFTRRHVLAFLTVLVTAVLTCLGAAVAYAQLTAFGYTGTAQTYTVPANVHYLVVHGWGAGGSCRGGGGAYILGVFAVTPGEQLTIIIGAGGQGGAYVSTGSVYTGGGASRGDHDVLTGGGGGLVAIFRNGTAIVVVGSGAGGSQVTIGQHGGYGGGGGGIAAGGTGDGGIAGGTQTSPGRGAGMFQGGNAIGIGTGGGAGLFGGGTGPKIASYNILGGGGGSSYIALLTSVTTAAGGNGLPGGSSPGGTGDPYYVSGIGTGGAGGTGRNGGNGRIVLQAVADNPIPSLISITPATTAAGAGDVSATITGANFVTASQVTFAGTAIATTYISSTSLQVVIPASLLIAPGTADVVVTNPAPGGGTSNALTFLIRPLGSTILTVQTAPRPAVTRIGNALQVTVTLQNAGRNPAVGVTITTAQLNGTNASSIQPTGALGIAVGGTATLTLAFPITAAPSGSAPFVTLQYASVNAGTGTLSVRCGTVP